MDGNPQSNLLNSNEDGTVLAYLFLIFPSKIALNFLFPVSVKYKGFHSGRSKALKNHELQSFKLASLPDPQLHKSLIRKDFLASAGKTDNQGTINAGCC